MAANPNAPLSLPDLLTKVLEDVRAGRFETSLSDNAAYVHAHSSDFRQSGDEVSYGRSHSLLWEVHDQAGRYTQALDVISPIANGNRPQRLRERSRKSQCRRGYRALRGLPRRAGEKTTGGRALTGGAESFARRRTLKQFSICRECACTSCRERFQT
jgi:hypothetical protein